VIKLHENELRIYDPRQPTRCKRFSGAIVSGAYDGAFMIDAEEHASAIGVHFRPGGAFPFLGISANELADMHVDLETLWGPVLPNFESGSARRKTLQSGLYFWRKRSWHTSGAQWSTTMPWALR
jgi:hypothetical protein